MKIHSVFVGLVVGIAFGLVGQIDAIEAENEELNYCSNVANKIWPDFKNIYKTVCKKP